jgi:hypothetical protein
MCRNIRIPELRQGRVTAIESVLAEESTLLMLVVGLEVLEQEV